MLDESGFPQQWCFLGESAHLGSGVSSVERQHEMGSISGGGTCGRLRRLQPDSAGDGTIGWLGVLGRLRYSEVLEVLVCVGFELDSRRSGG